MSKKKIFLIVITLVVIYISFCPVKQLYLENDNYKVHAMNNGTVYDGIELNQKFISNKNYKGISFAIGTYMKVFNKGNIHVDISDNNKIVYSKNINLKTIDDSGPIYLNFDVVKNTLYTIKIKTKNVSKNMPIVFYVSDEQPKKLIYNGKMEKYGINISYIDYKYSLLNIWYFLLFLSIIYMIYMLKWSGEKND